ncbi:sugar-binding protein [Paenibacillus planticolens]|uniref:Substrate-binding domain-containing protein n=1 Tax=Paenibacillus planticolens TaxID=2654976 RepID=A0ABX1ZTI2_9BACL|nr:sugar-binding protein [Paenibacillus planticolens]NOV02360.1 substrate-binding domain-containing protein [Paenibacillus planticolens]
MTDKKWLVSIALIISVFGFLLIRFASESSKIQYIVDELKGEKEQAFKGRHIVLIEQEQGHPYWQLVEKGATEAAQADHIAIECIGPVRNNMEEQIKLLEKAIASKVDGIIVQGLNDNIFTPVINKAVERGIPVLTIDTDAPTSKRLAYIGTDNVEAGRRLGQIVVQTTGGTGKIGVIIGSESAESQLQRLSGLRSVIDEYKGLQIVDVRASNISMMEAIQQAADMLQLHPDIGMMVGTSATDAFGILQAQKSLKRDDIRIAGFDDLQETLDAIRKGEIEATVVQQPYGMGEMSVHLFHDYFQGRTLPSTQFTKVEVIDKSQLKAERSP